jgi:hypothetical protein
MGEDVTVSAFSEAGARTSFQIMEEADDQIQVVFLLLSMSFAVITRCLRCPLCPPA